MCIVVSLNAYPMLNDASKPEVTTPCTRTPPSIPTCLTNILHHALTIRTPAMPADTDKRAAAQQAVDVLHEIGTILVRITRQALCAAADSAPQNCQLDRRALSICISLIERGVNPEALAQVVKELRQEAQHVEQGRRS
ncbi:Mitotic-spindle organizing protein 1 [Tolypocladium paradoxum]|uniref:Mitotic-spindle organizing protein 1 n=1 Tax=Tolypocladium paradoxum TaxID=94208 RepID=A0A2S4L6L9_9HYPO|nr:Mitotic-spindle organizing protein 1 [Tolypocladium paradoxum]